LCKDDVRKKKETIQKERRYLATLFRMFVQNSSTISGLYNTITARVNDFFAGTLLVC